MKDDISRYRAAILNSFAHGLKVEFKKDEHAPREDAEMTTDEQKLLWRVVDDTMSEEYTVKQKQEICRVFRAFQDHFVSMTLDLKEKHDEDTTRRTERSGEDDSGKPVDGEEA